MPMPLTGLAVGSPGGHRPDLARPPARLQLDHILAGRRVTRRGGEVLAPAGSDHRPVRARLRLANSAAAA
jgi:endonuclease/exonuclease/phosphatase family metal-dependent hydrolase